MVVIRLLCFVIGVMLVYWTLVSAIKTFVLPRGVSVGLTAFIFRFLGSFYNARARRAKTYDQRDEIMALYAPVVLFLLPLVFLSLILLGYMFLFWALEPRPLYEIFRISGSSLLTLGYASIDTWPHKVLEFSEAMIGLLLVALLIAYLPTMYSAFSHREMQVALLEGRAGSPPTAVSFIARSYRTNQLSQLSDVWVSWQEWFAEVEETHTSLAALSFFRSPSAHRSWVTASGVVLDSAAICLSVVDIPWEPRAAFCIRNGYIALRQIAFFFGFEYDKDPQPDDPISISKQEFFEACEQLRAEGVPLKEDLEQAWHDFHGWRVNYDTVLLALAAVTMAPYAPWVSDRSATFARRSRGFLIDIFD